MKNIVTLLFLILFSKLSYSQSPKPTCRYKVIVSKAYFHDQVEVESGRESYVRPNTNKQFIFVKRKAYLEYGDYVCIVCKEGDYKWIYVVFKNKQGKVTKGFINRSDLDEGEPW